MINEPAQPANGFFRGLAFAMLLMFCFGCGCSIAQIIFWHWLGSL